MTEEFEHDHVKRLAKALARCIVTYADDNPTMTSKDVENACILNLVDLNQFLHDPKQFQEYIRHA